MRSNSDKLMRAEINVHCVCKVAAHNREAVIVDLPTSVEQGDLTMGRPEMDEAWFFICLETAIECSLWHSPHIHVNQVWQLAPFAAVASSKEGIYEAYFSYDHFLPKVCAANRVTEMVSQKLQVGTINTQELLCSFTNLDDIVQRFVKHYLVMKGKGSWWTSPQDVTPRISLPVHSYYDMNNSHLI